MPEMSDRGDPCSGQKPRSVYLQAIEIKWDFYHPDVDPKAMNL